MIEKTVVPITRNPSSKPVSSSNREESMEHISKSPRHSTTQRLKKGSSGNNSVSDILGALLLKKKPSAADKRTSNLKSETTLKSSGNISSHAISSQNTEGEERDKVAELDASASHDVLNNESGISRLLTFGKRKLGVKNAFDSCSNIDKQKREREMSAAPQNTISTSKAAPSSNSAYDIRGPLNVQRQLNLDDYYLIRRVGKGGFATVFLVRLKTSTGRYYALKAMKKADVIRLRQEKQIMNEKNILHELKHWLLVELYNTFQTPTHLFMVMEFVCGGDLFTLLRRNKFFPEVQAKFYVCQVLIVLEYLHSKHVNILLDSTGNIKLADFGFAKRLTHTTSSFCGTPDYIAAEIVASKPYSFPVDWWSLGVLIFELVSGKTPFRADSSEGIYTNIQLGKIQWTSTTVGPIKDLCGRLLDQNPSTRLGSGPNGASDIKQSKWFSDVNWEKLANRGVTPPFVPPFTTPETLEMEKVSKGGVTDYRDLVEDKANEKRAIEQFGNAFKGF